MPKVKLVLNQARVIDGKQLPQGTALLEGELAEGVPLDKLMLNVRRGYVEAKEVSPPSEKKQPDKKPAGK